MRVDTKDNLTFAAIKEVYLNGVFLNNCLMADDELGVVELYKMGPEGIESLYGRYLTEIRKGEVKIVLNEDWEYVGGQLRMAE